MNKIKYILLFLILSPLFSCTKYITETITVREIDSTWIVTRDSLLKHKPDSILFVDSAQINTLIAKNSYLQNILDVLQIDIQDYKLLVDSLSKDGYIEPEINLSSDTARVFGTFADAWAFIDNFQIRLTLEEGKEFILLLENAIQEKNHYRELYHKQIIQLPAEIKTFMARLMDNLSMILVGLLLGALLIVLVMMKIKKWL